MRPGWNPTRRNRHAGTGAHGHGADNRLVIPESRHDAHWFPERLTTPVVVPRSVHRHAITFLVEPTRAGWWHPCTVDDVCAVMEALPSEDLRTVDVVVLRQPTRKQRTLSPVWGRAIFSYAAHGASGAAIVLEAQCLGTVAWGLSLPPDRARELERLRSDGHDVRRAPRRFEIRVTPQALRRTLLYRTLLHEIGHHVDRRCNGIDAWDARTLLEKEDFAHRYAARAFQRLRGLGAAPFDPRVDADSLARNGLKADWFTAPATGRGDIGTDATRR